MKTTTPEYRSLPLRASAGLFLLLAAVAPLAAQMNPAAPMPSQPLSLDERKTPEARRDDGRPMDDLKRSDRRFLTQASRLGEKELMLSRMAETRAVNPQVRAFAAQLVREHTSAHEELTALVAGRKAHIEKRDATEVREEQKKWAEKKGGDFDGDYLVAVINCHQDSIDALENGVDSDVPQIAAYAKKMLPIMKGHLARAESLEASVD